MASHGVRRRWPVAECDHANAEHIEISNFRGKTIREYDHCFDCGAKRRTDGTWR